MEVAAAPGGEHRPADRAQDALAVGDAGEDGKRREDPQWQEIVGQAAATRQIHARDQDGELARKVDEAVVKIAEEFNRIREQRPE